MPANTVPPTISGEAKDEKTLTASAGTWTGSPTITYAYQWESCNAAGESCTNISGATSATLAVGHDDVGGTLRVVVTATNSAGSTSKSSRSERRGRAVPARQHRPTGDRRDCEGRPDIECDAWHMVRQRTSRIHRLCLAALQRRLVPADIRSERRDRHLLCPGRRRRRIHDRGHRHSEELGWRSLRHVPAYGRSRRCRPAEHGAPSDRGRSAERRDADCEHRYMVGDDTTDLQLPMGRMQPPRARMPRHRECDEQQLHAHPEQPRAHDTRDRDRGKPRRERHEQLRNHGQRARSWLHRWVGRAERRGVGNPR